MMTYVKRLRDWYSSDSIPMRLVALFFMAIACTLTVAWMPVMVTAVVIGPFVEPLRGHPCFSWYIAFVAWPSLLLDWVFEG